MRELTQNWRIVLACFFGISLSAISIPFYTLGAFTVPLQNELGWSRAEIQAAMLFLTIGSVGAVPLVGIAIDRFGTRVVALVSIAVFALALANIGLTSASLPSFYLNWTLMAALGAGTMPVTWTRAINGWFDEQRGIALGFALAGTGVAGFVTPQIATALIESQGWRAAYVGLGVLPLAISLPLVFLFLRDPPGSVDDAAETGPTMTAANQEGATLREALGHWKLWVIAVAFFIVSFAVGGTIPNLIPLLHDGGMDLTTAASVAGSIGLAVIVGRVVAGILIDRFWAPAVAFVVFALPAVSCWLLAGEAGSIATATVAAVLIGLAAGAEFDMIAYLTSRYFGLRHYAKIYALPFAAFSVGAGIAPAMFGYVQDRYGSYAPILLAAAVFYLAGAALLLTLGRYPDFAATAKR